ncbi:MAK10-like protein [Tanacetum coccineum]
MEAHLASKPSVQVNKITSSCDICGGPHDTQIFMGNPEQAFVDYASSRTDEAGVSNFMASQNAMLSKFEGDFKQQQSEMANKINTFLKAINDRMTRALPSDTVKNPKLNVNPTSSVSSACSYPTEDPQSSSRPFNSINAIKTCFKVTNDFQKDQLQVKTLTVNKVETPKLKEPEGALEDEFKDLHLKLPALEVLAHAPMVLCELNPIISLQNTKFWNINVLELADGTGSYPVGIVKNVEVHVGKLKLLEDFYVIDMEKDPTCPLLVGRGFLATASAVIDLFRKMVEFLGAIPINLKGNMWESEDLIEKKIDWNKPPKEGDGPVTTEEKVQKKNDVKARSMWYRILT